MHGKSSNVEVANFCSVDGEVFELDPLSDKDSRRLLCKRVFNQEDGIYFELEEVTEKILKKCGGIPLAIITVASMLASIPNRTNWEWYGVYNAMGSGLENDKSMDNMRKILHLSYGDLPSYLKPCLLYLSLFPEDHDIPRSDLVRLWVAEGFVDEKRGSSLYDTGERYFNELVNRSMIKPIYINELGVPEACRVHDMILDLIISLSAQENFSIICEGPLLKSKKCKIRRILLRGKVDSNQQDRNEEQMIQSETVEMCHARSLVAFGDAVQWMPPLSMFSVLRVFSLEFVPNNKILHLKYLRSLHHLRYLKLGGKLEPEVLEGIGNLKLLKTFDLWSASIKQLPTSIVELRKLEHLLMGNYIGLKLPEGIGNLTSLQELPVLNVDDSPHTLAELGKLIELRGLTVYGLNQNENYIKMFLKSLSSLGNLRTLKFHDKSGSISLDSVSDQWKGPARLQVFDGCLRFCELPRWFSSLHELSRLMIRVMVLTQVDLQLLGALPVLRFLELHVAWHGTTEERLVIGSDQPFRSLVEFKFNHYTSCFLVFGQEVMPRLRRLELYFEARKREGGGFGVGLQNLTSLKHVTVTVDCEKARIWEVEDVETKIRDAIDSHLNHPTLMLSRCYEELMAEDESEHVQAAPEQQSV